MQRQRQRQSDEEAKILLGFSPNSTPSPSQIKSAYRKKAWETHPDLFPPHLKAEAESNFKLMIHNCNADLGSLLFLELSSWVEQINKSYNRLLLSSRPKWSSAPLERAGSSGFSSFCFHHLRCTCSCRINCFEGLWKAKGGSSLFQSFSPLNSTPCNNAIMNSNQNTVGE